MPKDLAERIIEDRIESLERGQRHAFGVAVALVVAGIGVAVLPAFGLDLKTLEEFAAYFQGSTSLIWSLAATVLVYAAFTAQRHQIVQQQLELHLTRQELALQRAALEAQKTEMVTQNTTLRRQQFESTFFELLRAHNDVLSRIAATDHYGTHAGAAAIGVLYGYVRGGYENLATEGKINRDLAGALRAYEEVYQQHESALGPYFRSPYNLFRYVDDARDAIPDAGERQRFAKFARARLASSELLLLFYNGLGPNGERMKQYVKEFKLFKHCPRTNSFIAIIPASIQMRHSARLPANDRRS